MREGGRECPHCGFLPAKKPAEFKTAEGELGLVDRNRKAQATTYDPVTRRAWHAMLIYIAQERGYKSGWAAHKYKEKFNEWPSRFTVPQPIEPTPEVRSWVRSRNIAYAKSRAA